LVTEDGELATVPRLIAARRQGPPAGPHAIEGALAKIGRGLPDALRIRLQAVQSSVTFLSAPAAPQPRGEVGLLLSATVQEQRRVRIRYLSHHEKPERDVDPYGLVSHWERCYPAGSRHLPPPPPPFRLHPILPP